MSETGSVDLFKSRLAQLKKVLERDARIAENLFYAALQLEKNKELKSSVNELIERHRMKVKKGYIYLPDDEKDRPGAVKALLKDAFDLLLKAFNVDKAQLVQRKSSEPKVHALQLFELQSTLEAQTAVQAGAFESTMQDLDTIDTSTPLEQSVIVPPPSEGDEPTIIEVQSPQTPHAPVAPVQPTTISKPAIAEQKPGESSSSGKPTSYPSPPVTPSSVRKPIPLPPRFPQRGTIQATPVVPPSTQAIVQPLVNVQKPIGSPALVPTRKPAPMRPVEATSAPASPTAQVKKPVPLPPTAAKPAPAPVAPVPASALAPPSPMTYEYYVCNRCGAETSKSAIRQVGTYLECPKCKFSFSHAEAVIIQKAAPGAEQVTTSGQEETKKPFDIYASKLPGEDESLVRPSLLFADREEEAKRAMKKVAPARVSDGGRPKPRPVPTDRLVRPSEVLGLNEDQALAEQPAAANKRPAEKTPSEAEKIVQNEASEYFNDQEPSITPETEKIAQAPASEYFVEETPDHPAWKKSPEIPPKAQPKVPPKAVPVAVVTPTEEPAQGDACPKCGALKYSKIQDRSKVISYNPLMYGYKKKCTMCSHEFD